MIVILHPIPRKYLERLSLTDSERIREALKGLEKEPPEGDIVPIVGQPGRFRARIGNYRILWRLLKDNIILIEHIEPRGQAYNKKNMRGKR